MRGGTGGRRAGLPRGARPPDRLARPPLRVTSVSPGRRRARRSGPHGGSGRGPVCLPTPGGGSPAPRATARSARSAARSSAAPGTRRPSGTTTTRPASAPDRTGDDDRLRLLFICCHPALAPEARIALTLRLLGGLTVPEIAQAFPVPESTMAQRITRAKKKIAPAKVPYRVPEAADLPSGSVASWRCCSSSSTRATSPPATATRFAPGSPRLNHAPWQTKRTPGYLRATAVWHVELNGITNMEESIAIASLAVSRGEVRPDGHCPGRCQCSR